MKFILRIFNLFFRKLSLPESCESVSSLYTDSSVVNTAEIHAIMLLLLPCLRAHSNGIAGFEANRSQIFKQIEAAWEV